MNFDRFSADNSKPFHSHEYAKIANTSSMGATSAETFGQRYAVDRNRQFVKQYQHSELAHSVDGERPSSQLSDQQVDQYARRVSRRDFSVGNRPSPMRPVIPQRQKFSEPPGRNYNPYG